MRSLKLLVAALAVVVFAADASAVTSLWFVNNGPGPGGPGASGTRLDLTCDTTGAAPRCDWNIDLIMNVPAADAGIRGWSMNLSSPNTPDSKLQVKAYNDGGTMDLPSPNAIFGPAPNLLQFAGGSQFFTPGIVGQNFVMASFVLSKDKNTGDTNIEDIFYTISVNFAQQGGGVVFGSVGPNGAPPGAPIALSTAVPPVPLPLPVIRITNIPEPGTLALLAVGAIGLIRRRR